MTSIITDDYKKSILRLYANGETKEKERTPEKAATFQSLLNSVESESKAKAASPIKNDQITTNSENITINGNQISSEAYKFVVPPPIAEANIIGDMPIDEDNFMPDDSLNLIQDPETKKPSTPQVVSSRRIPLDSTNEVALVNLTTKDFEMDAVKEMIITAGNYHGVDPSLGLAIARVESSFNPKAVSQDGFASKGIFQLLDSTGKDIHESSGLNEPYKPFDPSMNSFLGVGHFRRLLDLFSRENTLAGTLKTHPAQSADDLEKFAVAAFNAGEGNVARAQAKAERNGKDPAVFENVRQYLPEITKSYVDKVSSLRTQFADNVIDTKVG